MSNVSALATHLCEPGDSPENLEAVSAFFEKRPPDFWRVLPHDRGPLPSR